MKKTLKLIRKVGLGFGSTAGLFGLAILGCVAYGIKNGTIDNPLIKKDDNKEESGQ
jgi:hypothetical protein